MGSLKTKRNLESLSVMFELLDRTLPEGTQPLISLRKQATFSLYSLNPSEPGFLLLEHARLLTATPFLFFLSTEFIFSRKPQEMTRVAPPLALPSSTGRAKVDGDTE